MTDIPVKDSDAQPVQAVAASRDARPRPACNGTALKVFERQVLVFPLLVVVLACTSFLFGGTCAAWQWWTAVAAVVLVPFARRDQWRAAVGAAGLFALLLFALRCLIPPLAWDDTECVDMPVYHLPMVQLLIEGWNPVSDPLAEEITASLGLDLWGMAPLHVAFLPKTMAVFSAVSFMFVGDPYALTFPLPILLWLGLLLTAVRMFDGFARWAVIAALIGCLPAVRYRMPVDLGVAFSSFGLLLSMQDTLRGKKCDWLALTVWAAWMMNLKLNGVLGAFVFCAFFAVATILRNWIEWKKWIARFAAFGFVLVVLWGLVSWNPLGTSWRTYRHPLYPFKTIDAERFPVKDLTWDLQGENEDFRAMGKIGHLSHAFIAPAATINWYKRKLGIPDFCPSCLWWHSPEFLDGKTRAGLWLLFFVLFLLPRGRLWGAAGLFLLAAVPNHLVGYLRYQPWLSALGCLAVAFAAEWAVPRMNRRLSKTMSFLVLVWVGISIFDWCWFRATGIESKLKEESSLHPRILASFWPTPMVFYQQSFVCENFVPRYDYLRCMENYVRLLVRISGKEDSTVVLFPVDLVDRTSPDDKSDERNWHHDPTPENADAVGSTVKQEAVERKPEAESGAQNQVWETWVKTPFGFFIPVVKSDSSHDPFPADGETSPDDRQIDRRARSVLHAWLVSYPGGVWKRIASH